MCRSVPTVYTGGSPEAPPSSPFSFSDMALSPRTVVQRGALAVIGALALTLFFSTLGRTVEVEHHRTATGEAHVVSVSQSTNDTVLLKKRFSVRDGDRLDLNLGSDEVTVETIRGTTAEVIIEGTGRNAREVFERRDYQVFHRDGTLTVRTKPRRNGSWRSERDAEFAVTVRIPERFDASIDLGSGDVRLDRIAGDVTIDTGSGDLQLGDVRGGAIRLDTGSGDVDVDRLDGSSIVIDTGSGEVSVGQLTGRARISTGSGDVELATDGEHALDIDTGSGEVTVRLPRGLDADLVASGGDVRVDRALDFRGTERDRSARGTFGSGGPRIAIDTGSGDISVRSR